MKDGKGINLIIIVHTGVLFLCHSIQLFIVCAKICMDSGCGLYLVGLLYIAVAPEVYNYVW